MNIALRSSLLLIVVSLLSIVFILPKPAYAVGTTADAMCIAARDYTCACNTVCKPGGLPGGLGCPCSDLTAQFKTGGTCQLANRCKAISTSGADGLGLDKVIGILGQLMGQLMKGSQSSPTTPPPTSPTTGSGACASTYIVHVVTSDPCAVYVPNAIGGDTNAPITNSNVTQDLLNALNGGSTSLGGNTDTNSNSNAAITSAGSSTTDILSQFSTESTTTQSVVHAIVVGQSSSSTLNPAAGNVFGQSVNILPGLKGDISVLSNGATFIVGNRDQANNTEVAGFYGGDTIGSQPTGLVASWCQSRPWATNVLGKIIPPTFFDGLCSVRGYKVGETPVAVTETKTQVSITQSAAQPLKPVATTTVKTGPAGTPTVDIWASPTAVSLGARTSIFWTSSGAQSCDITSPDGSFSQHTLTGGASTVAITNATIFTISCLGADGSHATKNVTVQLAI